MRVDFGPSPNVEANYQGDPISWPIGVYRRDNDYMINIKHLSSVIIIHKNGKFNIVSNALFYDVPWTRISDNPDINFIRFNGYEFAKK